MGRVLMDLSEWATEEFTRRHKAIENAIYLIMFNKFGFCNTEEIKDFAIKHNCALCYDTDKNFIGISVNNRWLYTPKGAILRFSDAAYYDHECRDWYDQNDDKIAGGVTHWMPIELPEDVEAK